LARILIIDDDISVRIALRILLQKAGHETVEALNGKEGLRVFNQNPTDLIITDILMPERDGVETLLEIRAHHPDVKVMAISGNAAEFLPILEDLGAQHTMTKPFNADEVLEAVQNLLGEES